MALSDPRKIRSNKHLFYAHISIDIKQIINIISVKFLSKEV